MVRVSPGSPSKWIGDPVAVAGLDVPVDAVVRHVELAADEPLGERRVDQSRICVARRWPRSAARACSAQKPSRSASARVVQRRPVTLACAASSARRREPAVLVEQVRQGLVRHSVLQIGQQHVRASLNPLIGPASRRAAVRRDRRAVAATGGRSRRPAGGWPLRTVGSDPVAGAHPHVRRAEPGRVGGVVVGLVLGLALGLHPRQVVLDLARRVVPRPSRARRPSASATSGRGGDAAVPGLDRDPGAPGRARRRGAGRPRAVAA